MSVRHLARFVAVLAVIASVAGACGPSPTTPSGVTSTPAPPPPPPAPAPFVLSGEWVRISSSAAALDGMVVRVSSDATQATIVSTPANAFQFQVNDLKWRNITRVSETRFAFDDLLRQSGTGAMSYVPGFIDAQANGTELAMTFPSTGTVQQWRRR